MDHIARATVSTPKASGYLQQLCKHFGHKLETHFTPEAGSIEFDFGRADLRAQDEALLIAAKAKYQADLDRLRYALTSRLQRFPLSGEIER